MAGISFDEGSEEITGINVTPLVDVMLVLLIIFMVTATYIANKAIPVDLPKATTANDHSSKNLAFVLDKESKLYLNGNQVNFDDLPSKILEQTNKGQALQALISADKATPHGSVVKLIDVIRKNGITEFAIDVESE